MQPRPITQDDMNAWYAATGLHSTAVTIGGPTEGSDVVPCPATVEHHDDGTPHSVHVAWELDEIELAHLARGGTLWLTTYGGLPIHRLEVQEPS